MKTLLPTLLLSLYLGPLYCQSWYKYELLINSESNAMELTNKKFISHLRSQNIKIFNYLNHFEFISFESPDKIDSITLVRYLENYKQLTLIVFNRNETTKPIATTSSTASNVNTICDHNSITVLGSKNQIDNYSWFVIHIDKGGELDLIIKDYQATDDIDFSIWGPFKSIPDHLENPISMPLVRSNYSEKKGQTGLSSYIHKSETSTLKDQFEKSLRVENGEVYLIRVENFSNSGMPYLLTLEGTAALNCIYSSKNTGSSEQYMDSIKHVCFASLNKSHR